jgi:hypothetical protein
MTDYAPCPFCGGTILDTRGDNAVFCKNLSCEGGIDIGHAVGAEARLDVMRRWNRRYLPQPARTAEQVKGSEE